MRVFRDAGYGTKVAVGLVLAAVATAVFGLSHGLRDAPSSSWSRASTAPSSSSSSSPSASPTDDPWASVYPFVTKSGALIGGATTDVYLPLPSSAKRTPEPMPVVVLLGDPRVSITQYEQLAHDVAGYGVVVVVPVSGSAQARVAAVREWARGVVADDAAPAHGLVDPRHLLVLAHGSRALRGSLLPGVDAVAVYAGRPVGQGASAYATVAIDHADAMAVTDEGRTGARSSASIDPSREHLIADIAHWSALWLLTRTGDVNAAAFAEHLSDAPAAHVRSLAGP